MKLKRARVMHKTPQRYDDLRPASTLVRQRQQTLPDRREQAPSPWGQSPFPRGPQPGALRAQLRAQHQNDYSDEAQPLEEFETDDLEGVRSKGHRETFGPSAQLGKNLRIQAAEGFRAGVIELRPGLFLVAEVPSSALKPEFGSAALLAPLALNVAAKALENPEQTQAFVQSVSQGVQQLVNQVSHLAQPQQHASWQQQQPVPQPMVRNSPPQPAPTPASPLDWYAAPFGHPIAAAPVWATAFPAMGYAPPLPLLPASPSWGGEPAQHWLNSRRWP